MCRFIETICYKDGHYPLLDYHQRRVDKAFLAHFPTCEPHSLKAILPKPGIPGRYKVRVVYDASLSDIEFSEYHPRSMNKIKLISANDITYAHKYEDRRELQQLFDQREDADEILIIKNGLVTDSFYANPVFWDGSHWFVPSTYLLNGVRRQYLLEKGAVIELKIKASDIPSFEKISLVNAMVNLEELAIETRQVTN